MKYPQLFQRALPSLTRLQSRLRAQHAYDLRLGVKLISGSLRRLSADRKVAAVRSSGLFDRDYYLQRYPDVLKAGMDPVVHYVLYGANEGRWPNALFDTGWYLKKNPDVVITGENPLTHYLLRGEEEGRAPNAELSLEHLRRSFPETTPGDGRLLKEKLKHQRAGHSPSMSPSAKPSESALQETATKVRNFIEKGRTKSSTAPGLFRDFTEFNRVAPFISPLASPFSEESKRVLGFMQAEKRDLLKQAASQQHTPGPQVSIIVSGCDNAQDVSEVMESVRRQSYSPVEIVFAVPNAERQVSAPVDGAHGMHFQPVSVDDSATPQEQRALCVEQARGEWLLFLDSHTLPAPYAVSALVAATIRNPWAQAIVSARMATRSPSCTADDCNRLVSPEAWDDDGLALEYAWYTPAMLENCCTVPMGFLFIQRAHFLAAMQALPQTSSIVDLSDWDAAKSLLYGARVKSVPLIAGVIRRRDSYKAKQLAKTFNDSEPQAFCSILNGRALLPMMPSDSPEKVASMHTLPDSLVERGWHARATPTRLCTVIIPSYECLPYLKACIASVLTFTENKIKLVVVDNDSSEAVKDYLSALEQSATHHDVQVILNDRNYGFTYAVNQGIEVAQQGSDIVLLNNDAIVTPGWLDAMQAVIEEVPEAGIVVPRQTLLAGTKTMRVHNPRCDASVELDVNLSVHHGNILDPDMYASLGFIALRFAPFFCVYLTRELIDIIGPLDYESGPHYRSDQLYCEAARRIAEKQIIYTPFSKLYHFLQQSTTELKSTDKAEYQEIFVRNRWRPSSQAV